MLFNVIFVNLAYCDLIKNQYAHILKIYVNKNHSLNKSIWVHWLNFVSWLRFKYINVWYKRLDGSWINFLQCSVYFSMFMNVCACEQILIILLKYEPQKLCKLLCAGTRTHGTTQGTQVLCRVYIFSCLWAVSRYHGNRSTIVCDPCNRVPTMTLVDRPI